LGSRNNQGKREQNQIDTKKKEEEEEEKR